MVKETYSIKEASRELGVEAHALRYWEEELMLSVERNPQGRRIYSAENIKTFRNIIAWKEEGHSLKSIKKMLHETEEAHARSVSRDETVSDSREEGERHRIIMYPPKELIQSTRPLKEADSMQLPDDAEKALKARRLQELLKQFISESIRESNAEFLQLMKEGVLKELDYQFRLQEEREEEREKMRIEKEDAHFKRLDENLRSAMEKGKKKKHFLFSGK